MALRRAEGDDAFDVGQKAHVEHTINLIQHEMGEVGQMEIPLLHEVEKSSRRGDEDIDSTFDLFPLMAIAHAAVDQSNAQATVFGEFLQRTGDLIGEFASRFEDQGAKTARFVQVLEDR